jgi:hypothetical protein
MAKAAGGRIVFASVDSREVRRALSKLPKEVQRELRSRNKADGEQLKQKLQQAPTRTPQQDLVQKAILAKNDRNIRVEIGGKKRVGRQYKRRGAGGRNWKAPAGLLVFGSEYGSSGDSADASGRRMGRRFKLGSRKQGYWINPTTDKYVPELLAKWQRRVGYVIRKRGF